MAEQEQHNAIAAEIAHGADPWLAHIQHNTRGVLNPYIVGFYQDPQGKILTLYGPAFFKSKRQMENTVFGAREEDKQVNLLSTRFQKVQPTSFLRSNYWSSLPEDLRQHFERGEILVTGEEDLYALSESHLSRIANSNNPEELLREIDDRVAHAAQTSQKYFLLYYSDKDSDAAGRTGVIMQKEAGGMKPLIITINGQEFVVEVKGCGKKSGGFGGTQRRTGRHILTGGAETEQAVNEFNRLQDDSRPDAPKAIGSITFINRARNDYEQGYIIRLTPSTVRASYTGIQAYPNIEDPNILPRILTMYSTQLADHMFGNPPKILDRSSHTENLLLWGNGSFGFTDYSDHVVFSDSNFPQDASHSGYLTPKTMLDYYIRMVKDIPGFTPTDQKTFYSSLMKAFQAHGIGLPLKDSDDYEDVTRKIWENAMAYQVFRGRQRKGYIAQGVLDDITHELSDTFSHDRQKILVQKFQEYFAHELDVITTAENSCPPYAKKLLQDAKMEIQEKIQGFENMINTDLGSLYQLLHNPPQVKQLLSFSFYQGQKP